MDLARTVYSRDLKITAMRALDAGTRTGEIARKYQLRRRSAGAGRCPADRRSGAENRPADDGERFLKKSLAAFQGSSPASRRQWRGCLLEEVGEAAAKGKAVSALCQMTGLSRAGYYRWRVPPPATPVAMELHSQIQQTALEWPAYGYRRITAELQRRGFDVNHKRVLRLMREDNLLCLRRRSFVVTTDSCHNLPVYPNLAREMRPAAINQLWVADITYIRLRTEFVYLAVVLDAYSRRVIGWALGRTLEAKLAVSALRMAIDQRKPAAGLVHHSDRGVQYASTEYTGLLKQYQAKISMSRRGNPYDNAACESFMKTLKFEEVYRNEYRDLPDALASIGEFIERVYNQTRLHSALGYVPPVEFRIRYPQPHMSTVASSFSSFSSSVFSSVICFD